MKNKFKNTSRGNRSVTANHFIVYNETNDDLLRMAGKDSKDLLSKCFVNLRIDALKVWQHFTHFKYF